MEKRNTALVLEVFVKVRVGKFVGAFELIVIIKLFLNCVVCEVNFTWGVLHCKFWWRGSDVAFFIPVERLDAQDLDAKHKTADIEFSPLVEHWPDVLLKDKGLFHRFWRVSGNVVQDISVVFKNFNSSTSVWIFPRLQKPRMLALQLFRLIRNILNFLLPIECCNVVSFRHQLIRVSGPPFAELPQVLVKHFLWGDFVVIGNVVENCSFLVV